MLEGGIAYLKVPSFGEPVFQEKAVEFIRQNAGARAFIIDVRGNGGGLIWAGERLLQLLTPHAIEPCRLQLINTPENLQLARAFQALANWVPSLERALETGAAVLLAEKGLTPEQEDLLGDRLEATEEAEVEDYRRLDTVLHLTLAELTGSASLTRALTEVRMRVNDLLDAALPEGDWDSIGGLMFHLLGHVPVEGEEIVADGHLLRAEEVQGRRIGVVRLERIEAPPDDDDGGATADDARSSSGSGRRSRDSESAS